MSFGANVTYTQTDKDANWATTVRSEAFKKMPNKSPYVIDDATHLPLDQYFTRQTTDWEGVFKSNDTGSNATNYNQRIIHFNGKPELLLMPIIKYYQDSLTAVMYLSR